LALTFANSSVALAPKPLLTENQLFIQGNSIKGYNIPPYPSIRVYGDILRANWALETEWLANEKYPEMADLLICIAKNESMFNIKARGDRGLAYGTYQIHIDKHPVSQSCAEDIECSMDFTAKMIKENKGYLWTTYSKCL
jgi:hypothetical protein